MSRATIERLYAAFAALDGAAMQACCAENDSLDDEAFALRGRDEIGGMWRMLCEVVRVKVRAQAAANLRRFLAKG